MSPPNFELLWPKTTPRWYFLVTKSHNPDPDTILTLTQFWPWHNYDLDTIMTLTQLWPWHNPGPDTILTLTQFWPWHNSDLDPVLTLTQSLPWHKPTGGTCLEFLRPVSGLWGKVPESSGRATGNIEFTASTQVNPWLAKLSVSHLVIQEVAEQRPQDASTCLLAARCLSS